MKSVVNYKEFNDKENAPSILEDITEKEIPGKSQILRYMKSFEEDVVCPARVYDEVSQKYTLLTLVYYTDGEFVWDESVIYHFEKYNIVLDTEFIKKALR